MGVTAASAPPQIITSASPRSMILKASPMACAPAEHAVHVALLGPRAPNRIETWPAARFAIAAGMKKGEIFPGPPSRNFWCSRSITEKPPIPEPM